MEEVKLWPDGVQGAAWIVDRGRLDEVLWSRVVYPRSDDEVMTVSRYKSKVSSGTRLPEKSKIQCRRSTFYCLIGRTD